MARRTSNPTSQGEIGARLALTRQALGYTQAMMSKLMGSATAGHPARMSWAIFKHPPPVEN